MLSLSNERLLIVKGLIEFTIDDDTTALEETRLKYRYLDIRRNEIKDKLTEIYTEIDAEETDYI